MDKHTPVLIVDDYKTMLRIIRNLLKQLEFDNVEEATDGQEALAKIAKRPVHLVLSDFNMPGMDGLTLLKSLRTQAPTKGVGFILITGRADRELVQRAVQFGVNNYLVKPFTVQQLKDKLEAVFGPLT